MDLTPGEVDVCLILLDSLYLIYRYFISQETESVFHPFICLSMESDGRRDVEFCVTERYRGGRASGKRPN